MPFATKNFLDKTFVIFYLAQLPNGMTLHYEDFQNKFYNLFLHRYLLYNLLHSSKPNNLSDHFKKIGLKFGV
jgi:hypothetical protein